jgi:excisionase family DNA binding protein
MVLGMDTIEPWLSVQEIAQHLTVSKETIYRWLDRKQIPAHRIGRLWRFKATEVDNWVMQGGAAHGSPTSQSERETEAGL